MRFSNSWLLALFAAFLAIVAVSEVVHDTQSIGRRALPASITKRARPSLGSDPRSKDTLDFIKEYCNKGIDECKKQSAKVRGLNARARPTPPGFTNVPMDQVASTGVNDPGLFTNRIGTCVGIAIIGKSGRPEARTAFLLHLNLGINWNEVESKLNLLADAMERSKQDHALAFLDGMMVTIDTSLNKDDANTRNDPVMQDMARDLEPTYARINTWLSTYINAPVRRVTHGFGTPVDMTVTGRGDIEVKNE